MTLLHSIFRNFGMVFLSDLVGRLLSFFLIISIAGFLGAEGLGFYSFIFAFVGLFVVFNDLGLSQLLVREVARRHSEAYRYFSNILSIKIIIGVLTFAATAIAILVTEDRPFLIYSVLVASVGMFFSSMKDSVLSVFQSFEKMEFISLIRVVESFLIVGLSVSALTLGYGILAVAIVFMAVYFLTFLVSLLVVSRIIRPGISFCMPTWRQFLSQSAPFWLTGMFIAIYFRIDTVMLGVMRGYDETGIYNAAYRLLDALYIIPGAVIPVIYPVMSRLHVSGRKVLTELYRRAFSYLVIIALPMAVGATLLAGRILPFVYRGNFSADAGSAAVGLQILIWAEVFIFLSSVSGYMLNSINRQRVFAFTAAGAAVLNFALNLYFISRWGYVGAAITTVMTELGILVVLFHFVRRAGYRINALPPFVRAAVGCAVMVPVIFLLTPLHVLLIIPAAALVYFAVVFSLGGFERQDVELVRSYAVKVLRR